MTPPKMNMASRHTTAECECRPAGHMDDFFLAVTWRHWLFTAPDHVRQRLMSWHLAKKEAQARTQVVEEKVVEGLVVGAKAAEDAQGGPFGPLRRRVAMSSCWPRLASCFRLLFHFSCSLVMKHRFWIGSFVHLMTIFASADKPTLIFACARFGGAFVLDGGEAWAERPMHEKAKNKKRQRSCGYVQKGVDGRGVSPRQTVAFPFIPSSAVFGKH